MSDRSIHSVDAHELKTRGRGERCRRIQLAEALLAAGALLAEELEVDEEDSVELDDSFAELDDESEFDELEEEATVLELLARESVA